jgi:hypothetical protein
MAISNFLQRLTYFLLIDIFIKFVKLEEIMQTKIAISFEDTERRA